MIVRDLRISPLRTLLTSLSMFIGIIALIASVLIGSMGGDYLEAVNARAFGKSPTWRASISGADLSDPTLVAALTDGFEAFPGGVMAPEYQQDGLTVRRQSNGMDVDYGNVTFVLTSAARIDVYPMIVDDGTWLTDAGLPAPVEVVLNRAARNTYAPSFGSTDDAENANANAGELTIGVSGSVQQVTARINGVVNDGDSQPRIYVNAASLAMFAPQLWNPQSLTVSCHIADGFSDSQVNSALADMMADTVGGRVGGWQRIDGAGAYASVLSFLQAGTAVTAMLLLLVSAIGVLNIGLAGIEQRSRELLIRRAFGATRLSIVMLVMGSSLLLGLMVALAAVAVSFAGVSALPAMLTLDVPLDLRYPVSAAGLACLAAMVTSLAGTLIPAVKASRLQPALALRG